MSDTAFNVTSLLRPDLPAPAVPWEGVYPPFNFTGGHNAPDCVPVEDLMAAATRAIKKHGVQLSTYFLDGGYLGHRPLRDFLEKKLKKYAGMDAPAENILLTSGSLQAMDLINSILLDEGDTVLIEEANYEGVVNRLARIGANVISLTVDEGGMSMEALENALKDCKQKGVTPKYIYTIPTIQNPSATIMNEERRRRLIELATEYETLIFEDDCYADLTFDGKRPPAIHALDEGRRTIHIGSFSKTVAPALRVGFVVADWQILGALLSAKKDAGSGALEQMLLAEYCEEHFDTHIVKLRQAFKSRADALVEAVEENFGTAAEFTAPPGGMFLWIKMPKEVDTGKLAALAPRSGITINPGAEWSQDLADATRWFRVCFAWPTEDVIRSGIAKLAEICREEFGVPARIANREKSTRT